MNFDQAVNVVCFIEVSISGYGGAGEEGDEESPKYLTKTNSLLFKYKSCGRKSTIIISKVR